MYIYIYIYIYIPSYYTMGLFIPLVYLTTVLPAQNGHRGTSRVLGPLGEALQVLGAAGGHRTENHPQNPPGTGSKIGKNHGLIVVNSG